MLLRKITKHVTDQNWFAVFIDFLIVVVGVFIGIQVANWNADRGERQQERDYLLRLHADTEKSIANQSRDINFFSMQLADQAIVLKSLKTCEVDLEDRLSFQRAINMLGFINAPRFSRRTVDEMTASGQTDTIRNTKILTTLADIVALTEWRGSGMDSVTRSVDTRRFVVEEYVQYDLSRTYPDDFIGDFVGVDFDIKAMCADSKIASAISSISFHTRERRNAYEPIIDNYKTFLSMIEAELKQRWGDKTVKNNNL